MAVLRRTGTDRAAGLTVRDRPVPAGKAVRRTGLTRLTVRVRCLVRTTKTSPGPGQAALNRARGA
ncbi:hypothetical protein AB0D38_43375 [Streptomyces sp. NPDC048279]|uniref:hypothetical protein n=1 Tax=Streptomyces sp. NPDC048279 TaxID=3154714 RepID=UPI00341237BF